MKIKRILKFYFCAEKINLHIDRLIMKYACDPEANCFEAVQKINLLIDEKQKLNNLWSYIDKIAGGLSPDEVQALKDYSQMITSIKKLDAEAERRIRRAGVKFARRARRLKFFDGEIRLVKIYYTLL